MFLKFKITDLQVVKGLLEDDLFSKYNTNSGDKHQPFIVIEFNQVFNRFDSKESHDPQPNIIKIPLYDYKRHEKNISSSHNEIYTLKSSPFNPIKENSVGLLLVSLYFPKLDEFDSPCMILQSTNELIVFNDSMFEDFNSDKKEKKEKARIYKTKFSNAKNVYGSLEIELESIMFHQKEPIKNITNIKKDLEQIKLQGKLPFISPEKYSELLKSHIELLDDYNSYIKKDLNFTRYLAHTFDTYNNKERSMLPSEILMHNTYPTSSNFQFWENVFNLSMIFIEDHTIYEHLFETGVLEKKDKKYDHKDIYNLLPNIRLKMEVLSNMISMTANNMRYVSDVRLDFDQTKNKYYWTENDNFNDLSELSGNCSDMAAFTHYVFECFKKFDSSHFKDKNHSPLLELHSLALNYECCISYCMLEHDLHTGKTPKALLKKNVYKNHQKNGAFHRKQEPERENKKEQIKTKGNNLDSPSDIYHATCLLINKYHLLNSIDTNSKNLTGDVGLGIFRLIEMETHSGRIGNFKIESTGKTVMLPKIMPMETTFLMDPEYYDDDSLDELNNLDGNNKEFSEKLEKYFNVEKLTQTKEYPLLKKFFYLITNLFIDNDYMYPINVPILKFKSTSKQQQLPLGITFDELESCKFEVYYQFDQKSFESNLNILKTLASAKPQRLGLFSPTITSKYNTSYSIYNSVLLNNGTYQFLNPKKIPSYSYGNNKKQKRLNQSTESDEDLEEMEDDDLVKYRFRVATFLENDFLKLSYETDYLFFQKIELLSNKLILYVVWF
jgi:hypothetical protein